MLGLERLGKMKTILVVVAIFIAIASLLTSHFLIRDLQREEAKSMEVWAEAMRTLNVADENTDLNLVLKVINGNDKIPVVVLDSASNVLDFRNLELDARVMDDSLSEVGTIAAKMKERKRFVRIFLAESVQDGYDEASASQVDYIDICYDDSLILKRLARYPYVQLTVVVVFVLIAFFALFSSMRAEQNKVWVGLSKETAHQLGTPISSLMAWTEVLRENYPDDDLIPEMAKDVERLERIADRFSKIGSIPEPKVEDLSVVLRRVVDYLSHRFSNKVVLTTHFPEEKVEMLIVAPLFEWVAENLCKNAVDAMSGEGCIDIYMYDEEMSVIIDISDTGKGISKANYKDVFKPGYTTKSRGWGLGLSLAKRIVEEYHKGKIFVKSSEIGKGTTFRIELPKGR
jgi:signal transduction histidine kinase